MDCFKCGGDSAGVIEVISNKPKEGIILVCRKCAAAEGLVELKRPDLNKLKEIESGDKEESFRKGVENFKPAPSKSVPEDVSLRELVEKNYSSKIVSGDRPKDLVRNFHWIIMRERRKKKLTHEQLAEAIGESETAIKMAEKGVLPSDGNKLIQKIEAFLGIYLAEDGNFVSPIESIKSKTISGIRENPNEAVEDLTDKVTSQFVTIGDLKKVKNEGVNFSMNEDGSFDKDFQSEEDSRSREEIMREDFVKRALERSNGKGFGDDTSKKSFRELHEQRVGKIPENRVAVPDAHKEESFIRSLQNSINSSEEKKEDLSDEDINKLIFGK